jgi:hypothetical protein
VHNSLELRMGISTSVCMGRPSKWRRRHTFLAAAK